jgi:hypothetical protein
MKYCHNHELFLETADILRLLPWWEVLVPKIIRRYVITFSLVCNGAVKKTNIQMLMWERETVFTLEY